MIFYHFLTQDRIVNKMLWIKSINGIDKHYMKGFHMVVNSLGKYTTTPLHEGLWNAIRLLGIFLLCL